MSEANRTPDEEGRDTAEVDDVAVGLAGTGAHVHHAQSAAQVGEDDGRNWDTTLVGPAEELGSLAILSHEQDCTAGNINGAVDGAESGNEDERIDEVDSALPARILDGDCHGTSEGTLCAADETLGVGRAGQTEEKGTSHVDDNDADEDLTNGEGNGTAWIPGLGRSNGDSLNASVESTAEDEDRGNAPEPVCESAWVVPVFETDGWGALNVTRSVDNAEEKVGDEPYDLDQRQPKLSFTKGFNAE